MTLTNAKMEAMIEDLKLLLPHRDKIGYAAARNTRILNDALTEYSKFKNDLILKYGKDDTDKEGNALPTVSLKYSDPNFKEFTKELEKISTIEHSVTLMTLKYEEIIGLLSGEEILRVSWMLED